MLWTNLLGTGAAPANSVTLNKVAIVMKLVVLGANGRTGVHVVQQALEQGFEVAAVVRSETKRPSVQHANLTVAVGDPCDPGFLAETFAGKDAVISTLGGRAPIKKATSIYPRSAEAIMSAASKSGLKRVLVTSSALLFDTGRLIDKILIFVVHRVVSSATRMEQTLLSSGLDVTIARCGFLNDGDETAYRAEPDALPANGSSIARQSLSRFLIDSVQGQWRDSSVYGVSCPESGEG
jgi:hypothetical protein